MAVIDLGNGKLNSALLVCREIGLLNKAEQAEELPVSAAAVYQGILTVITSCQLPAGHSNDLA